MMEGIFLANEVFEQNKTNPAIIKTIVELYNGEMAKPSIRMLAAKTKSTFYAQREALDWLKKKGYVDKDLKLISITRQSLVNHKPSCKSKSCTSQSITNQSLVNQLKKENEEKKEEKQEEMLLFPDTLLPKEEVKEEIKEEKKEIRVLNNKGARVKKWKSFDLDFVDDYLFDGFVEFLDMRQKVNPIKTIRAINMRYKELIKYGEGDIERSKLVLDQSLDNEWEKFYQLKREPRPVPKNQEEERFFATFQRLYPSLYDAPKPLTYEQRTLLLSMFPNDAINNACNYLESRGAKGVYDVFNAIKSTIK